MKTNERSLLLKVVAKWASELDTYGDFAVADDLDSLLEKHVGDDELSDEEKNLTLAIWKNIAYFLKSKNIKLEKVNMIKAFQLVDSIVEDLGGIFSKDMEALDDGIMGLNDPEHPTVKAASMKDIEISLLQEGMYREAMLIRTADLTSYLSPQQVADSVRRMITHFMQRANIQDRAKYLHSVKRGLVRLDPVYLSQKKSNPASAIGAAISMIKSLLIGQKYETITAVISELHRILG